MSVSILTVHSIELYFMNVCIAVTRHGQRHTCISMRHRYIRWKLYLDVFCKLTPFHADLGDNFTPCLRYIVVEVWRAILSENSYLAAFFRLSILLLWLLLFIVFYCFYIIFLLFLYYFLLWFL